MARRGDHSKDEIRALAIRAARELAQEEGLRGITARRVADKIGYVAGTLYTVFADLDDLVLNLNADTLDRLAHALADAGSGRAETRPTRLIEAYFSFIEADLRLWTVVFEYTSPAGRSLPDWYTKRLDRVVWIVEHALMPLMEQLSGDERRARIIAMWAALHGISTLSSTGKLHAVDPRAEPRRLAEIVVSSVLTARAS
jgi:AcrR family transcriptional regulator